MLSFNKKRYKTKKIIFITAIITGSILLSTIFSVVFIVLDPKKQKKNINDFHFNTELNIRDFNPSDELLTNEFKRVNNNILKT